MATEETASNREQEAAPHLLMMQLVSGHFRSQAVYVAAELGIPDLVADRPKSAEEISNATGADSPSLYRLLRALSSIGVFAEDDEGRFGLTPLADTLRSDAPMSLRALARLAGASFHWGSWSNLYYSVMTGKCAFERVHGVPLFDYLTGNPDAAARYDAWMTRATEAQVAAIVDSYDFSSFRTVVDVAGGHGGLLAAILSNNPKLKGILFDLPEVVAAGKELHKAGVEGRSEMVGGDMFDSVPDGGDLYILKTIIHDWSDALSIKILRNCRAAMGPDSRLLLIESIMAAGNTSDFVKFMDLNMLVLTDGGMERTESEFERLLSAAGFRLLRTIPTKSPMSILESAPEP